MPKLKHKKTRGLSAYFQDLKEGDRVAITLNPKFPHFFPKRIIGLSGIIKGRKGMAFIIELKEGNKVKKFIIRSVHLKKLRAS